MKKIEELALQILNEPDWFPNKFDANAGTVEMLKLDRELIASTTFLAAPGFPPENTQSYSIPLKLLSSIKKSPLAPAYLFHSAFCCSTLLARVLDLAGKVCSLKEPQVTMDIADFIRRTGQLPQHIDTLKSLLIRTSHGQERVIIKPTNMANNLLLHKTALLKDSPILFLYGSLRGFLVSVLKKGEEGRFMTRRMYMILAKDPTRFKDIPASQLATLTDLQIAAMLWLLQTELFESKLNNTNNQRMKSLHCDEFLQDPSACIQGINQHFDLGLSAQDLDALINGDVLTRDSKQQTSQYNADKRHSETLKIEQEFGPTLDKICLWANGLSLGGKVVNKLSCPLL